MDDQVWDLMVRMTNMNAHRKRQAGQHKGVWQPIDVLEMQAFIGMLIITGIVRLPRLAMYWDTSSPLCMTPGFAAIMSRDRFLQIMRYLHVNDKEADRPANDKLYKVREVVSLVNANFASKYVTGCQIWIDESLIPFKGRLSYRQFIPSKRARFGIKCWVLADASNSFVSRFSIYTGRDLQADPEVPLSSRVVHQLVDGLDNVNHQLFVDNFYTSPSLFTWLLSQGIYACGTVRKGRVGFPKELYFAKGRHERGTSSYRTRDDLLATCWYDSKGVYFLSTLHSAKYRDGTPAADQTVRRRSPNGPIDVPAPPLLHDYNKFMGGVDLADAILKNYSIGRKTFRAYRRILYYCIELCIRNACLMEKFVVPQAGGHKRGALQFRRQLAEELVAPFRAVSAHRHVGRPRLTQAERLTDVGQHTPAFRPGKQNNKASKVCSRKAREAHKRDHSGAKMGHVKRTNFCCMQCDVHLCIGEMADQGRSTSNCFFVWHHNVEFWRA